MYRAKHFNTFLIMQNQKNIPILRFPDFSGEWKKIKLGNYFIERNDSTNEEFPLYSLTIEKGIIPKSERYERSFLVNDIDNAYKVMNENDFAYNPMNLRFGALARHKENKKVLVSKYYNIFYCNGEGSSAFFEYYLTSNNLIQYYNKMATGSLIEKKRVHYLDFINFKKHLPELPEQTKIASFLTAVDDKLTQLKKKKSLLEQYKKGVMQKIFSQELRFKDNNGEDYAEWEEMKLEEIYRFNTTNSFSRENLNYEVGSVKNIHYGDIHTKFLTHFDITKELVPFLNPEISLQKFSIDNYCKEGDLIVADASEDYTDIGKSIEIVNLNNEKVVAGLHTLHARPNLEKLAIGFSGHLMKSENIRLQIKTQAQGTKVLSITTGRLSQINITLPSLPEQTKIANFLSAIDDKINQCGVQIEKMEDWKKGLLQKMFI